MSPMSRTFVFDSADADLFDTYDDVEATFFSSTDSDSSLSESSTTTSTDSSDESSSDESLTNGRRQQSRSRAGSRAGSRNDLNNSNNNTNNNNTHDSSSEPTGRGSHNNNIKGSASKKNRVAASIRSSRSKRKSSDYARSGSDSDDDLYKKPNVAPVATPAAEASNPTATTSAINTSTAVPGRLPSAQFGSYGSDSLKTPLPLYNTQATGINESYTANTDNNNNLLTADQTGMRRRGSTNSSHSFYSAYSMHTLSTQRTRDSARSAKSIKSAKSSKSQRRADPLHKLKGLMRRRKATSSDDEEYDDDGYGIDEDDEDYDDDDEEIAVISGNVPSTTPNILKSRNTQDDEDEEGIVEIQVGNDNGNNNPPGIMMSGSGRSNKQQMKQKNQQHRPQSKIFLEPKSNTLLTQNGQYKDGISKKVGGSVNLLTDTETSGPVVIEEPVESKMRKRRRRRRRANAGDGDNDDDDDDDNDGTGEGKGSGHRRSRNSSGRKKDGHRLRRTISHRHYTSSMTSASAARRRAGWDPGIDIRTTQVMLQSVGSTVTIVDYNATRYRVVQTEVRPESHKNDGCDDDNEDEEGEGETFEKFDVNGRRISIKQSTSQNNINADFYHHLDNRPAWSSVRWISVNGLSWEAISAISKRFQLHRLAIEDMVEIPQRTKADMYPTHIFCVLPMHKLIYYKPAVAKAEAENAAKKNKKGEQCGNGEGGTGSGSENGDGCVDGEPEIVVSKAKSITTFMMPEWMSERVEKVWDSVAHTLSKHSSSSNNNNNDFSDEQIPGAYPRELDSNGNNSSNAPRASLDRKRARRNSLSYTAPLASLSHIGHRVNANASKLLRIHDSDSSTDDGSSSDDSDSEARKSVARLLSKQQDKTIYDWNNTYTRNSKHKIPSFIEEKHPLATYRRAVGVEQVSLFLTNKQTVISFFERSAPDIERPLLARLASQSTMLRESCDTSMLLQAIIDIIVDQVQPIITAYRRRFTELEVAAMVTPTMTHTQDLHLMAGELSLLRNTIFPISTLVQSLRDHNDQTANKSKVPVQASTVKPASPPQSKPLQQPQQPNINAFFSTSGNNDYIPATVGAASGAANPNGGVGNGNGGSTGSGSGPGSNGTGVLLTPGTSVNSVIGSVPQRNSKYTLYEGPDKTAAVRDFTSVGIPNAQPGPNLPAGIPGSLNASGAPGSTSNNAGSMITPISNFPTVGTQISGLAKLYLGDIGDHLFSYTQDIDMMRENTQNMIEMIFNTISYKSGESINQLSFVTVIFMPLTFWAGYFGMNFKPFDALTNGANFFWKISVPFTAGLLVLVMLPQICALVVRMFRSLKRRWHKRQHRMEKRMRKKLKKKEV